MVMARSHQNCERLSKERPMASISQPCTRFDIKVSDEDHRMHTADPNRCQRNDIVEYKVDGQATTLAAIHDQIRGVPCQ